MNNTFSETNNTAMIIARCTPATQHAMSWLEQQGYQCIRKTPTELIHQQPLPSASLFIVDTSPANRQGLEILQQLLLMQPAALRIALCRGGNSPVMRCARAIGVDGFLYMDDKASSVDLQRGFAATVSMFQTDRFFRTGSGYPHHHTLSHARHTHVTTMSSYAVRMQASSTRRFPWVPADR